jgi:hypothetical protein
MRRPTAEASQPPGGPLRLARIGSVVRAFAAAGIALSTAGCDAGERSSPDTAHGSATIAARSWQAIRAVPLSPRQGAVGVWTGHEALIVGGSDARPCPPNASCPASGVPPLSDGAAFDPETRRWRRIASSPVPFEHAESAILERTAYLWIADNPARASSDVAFLAYSAEENRWKELPLPPSGADRLSGIAQAGDRIVAYAKTHAPGDQPDFLFDPASNSWSELPRNPLSPSSSRTMAWSGHELVLFDHETVADASSAERPALTRAAALDFESGAWRRLPDSEILGTRPWIPVDGRLLNPMLGSADGGEVNNWGRSYPYGGILDLSTSEWSPLPDRPSGEETVAAGVLTPSRGYYFSHRGWVLDTATSTWTQLPPIDEDAFVTGRTVVAAGARLLVFGGVRWSNGNRRAELLNTASIW